MNIKDTEGNQERLSPEDRKWLANIWGSKKIESEYGDCPVCGESNIEFQRWELRDGTIRRYNDCPVCIAKYEEEQKHEESKAKQKEVDIIRERWRNESGVPIRFLNNKFSGFDMNVDRSIKQVRAECERYANDYSFLAPQNSKSLLMYSRGVWGVGKTYLVCSIANAIMDKWNDEVRRCPVFFVSEPQLFLKVRSTYNRQNKQDDKPRETEESIYERLTTVPLLIIDDVGKEEVSDPRFVQRVLFAIIDGRYQNMLPIIITANLTPDELGRHLGGDRGNSATMDRLVEMTDNTFWELRGSSYRDISKREKLR